LHRWLYPVSGSWIVELVLKGFAQSSTSIETIKLLTFDG